MKYEALFVIFSMIGYLGSWRLVLRDRIRNSAELERGRDDYSAVGGEIVGLAGREYELTRISRLSTRSRTTIALTGRRGTGKSRLLREIYKREVGAGRIGVWIDCPTRVGQEEFISTLLEKLALAIESACAQAAGDVGIAIKKLESRSVAETGIILFALCAGLISIAISLLKSTHGPEMLGLWIPSGITALVALGLLAWDYIQTRSISGPEHMLGSKNARFQMSVLYNRAIGILSMLRERMLRERESGRRTAALAVRFVALVFVGLLAAYFINEAVFYQPPTGMVAMMGLGDDRFKEITIALAMTVVWLIIYAARPAASSFETSALTLIGAYREFAFDAVYRIKAGALGRVGPPHN